MLGEHTQISRLRYLKNYSYAKNLTSIQWYSIDNTDIQPKGR
jgi:hypothetical protein